MGFPRQLSGLHLPAILPTSGSKRARPYTPETGSFQPDPKRRNAVEDLDLLLHQDDLELGAVAHVPGLGLGRLIGIHLGLHAVLAAVEGRRRTDRDEEQAHRRQSHEFQRHRPLPGRGFEARRRPSADQGVRMSAGSTGSGSFWRMVTNSSAAVGWIATASSNCCLVAPNFTAMAMAWMISGASGPSIWAPSTRWLARSTTSFIRVRSCRPERVCFMGRKFAL